MNLLLTSDLDRTLIFSKRTKLQDVTYRCIEKLDGEDLSYMSNQTIKTLHFLKNTIEFVPVTTRSLVQYNRITIFKEELKPSYAITSNGGKVLINGQLDLDWQQHIAQQMNALTLRHEEVHVNFSTYLQDASILRTHNVEDLFYVSIIDENLFDYAFFIALQKQLEQFDWVCYLQGRKLYILPAFLTKGAAVTYIKNQGSYDWHAAAGDSQLDLSMLEIADEYFIPQHAGLAQKGDLNIMNESSSNFSEQFLQKIVRKKQNFEKEMSHGKFK